MVEADTFEVSGVIKVTRPREIDPRVIMESAEEALFGDVAVSAVGSDNAGGVVDDVGVGGGFGMRLRRAASRIQRIRVAVDGGWRSGSGVNSSWHDRRRSGAIGCRLDR